MKYGRETRRCGEEDGGGNAGEEAQGGVVVKLGGVPGCCLSGGWMERNCGGCCGGSCVDGSECWRSW
jgi:hypothetical protein